MTRSVFISTENTADEQVVRVMDLLRSAGYAVTTSPINPALGDDSRWKDWYESGCKAAMESNDVFLAVVADGYDSSTWMAVELQTAWHANRTDGKPLLFMLHRSARPLAPAFRRYEEGATMLPFDVAEAS